MRIEPIFASFISEPAHTDSFDGQYQWGDSLEVTKGFKSKSLFDFQSWPNNFSFCKLIMEWFRIKYNKKIQFQIQQTQKLCWS